MASNQEPEVEAPAPPTRTGTAIGNTSNVPNLFRSLKIGGLELQNRIIVSPIGMYSSHDGHLSPFHLVHLGSFALRGAGLTFVEGTAVLPNGRTSPADAGLWKDDHIEGMRKVVDFVHGLDQKIGIQLAHAGRKSSMLPIIPGSKPRIARVEDGGWEDDVVGPSSMAFAEGYPAPREMTGEDMKVVVDAFAEAAKRAVRAGFDAIEVHGGHGYLISNFLSPLTNHRTDRYGGSFANRIRFPIEIIKAVRSSIPESMPLSLRISATEWMEWGNEPSWGVEDSIKFAKLLPGLGVDLLDVSSGGNDIRQKIPLEDPNYQIRLAGQIRSALREEGNSLLVGAVGRVNSTETARTVLEPGEAGESAKADLVFVAREFLRDSNFVLRMARELGIETKWPFQYVRAAPQ